MRRQAVAVAVMCVAACAAPHETPILVATPGRSGVVVPIANPSLEETVARAVADLSRRISIAEPSIRVLGAAAVDWPSSALGCPQPDRMYMTVLTPRYEIVLEAAGIRYHYHAARQGEPFLCPAERREPPAATGA